MLNVKVVVGCNSYHGLKGHCFCYTSIGLIVVNSILLFITLYNQTRFITNLFKFITFDFVNPFPLQ